MSKEVLVSGDQAIFEPQFGAATVAVQAGILKGSSRINLNGKVICVEGDEKQVVVLGCSYIVGAYVIPGMGNLHIDQLNSDQVVPNIKLNGRKVLVKGSLFKAKFKVTQLACRPTEHGPEPHGQQEHLGQGHFEVANPGFRIGLPGG